MNRGAVLAAARRWRELGVVTIPVRYMSKVPLVKWTPWVKQMPPAALSEYWLRKMWPCNLAVILKDGLTVLDFDEEDAYTTWALKMGHMARSFTVRSRRGYHVYLWLMDWESKTYAMTGGELKSNGIAIVPPSLHAFGHRYAAVCDEAPILGVAGIDDLGVEVKQELIWQPSRTTPKQSQNGTGTVARIKSQIDIGIWLSQYTTLRPQSDGSLVGTCPFHDDHHPSLQVWPNEGRCYCHSTRCRANRKIDVITAASLIYNVSMASAITILAEEL